MIHFLLVGLFSICLSLRANADIGQKWRQSLYGSKETVQSQQAILGYFDGCYSDTEQNLFMGSTGFYGQVLSANTNAMCVEICQDKGSAVAATKGSTCYCTDNLPLPRLHDANDPMGAGNSGPCNTRCPGVFSSGSCRGDECCGGNSAYSVYIVGNIDVLKTLMRRILLNFQSDPTLIDDVLTSKEKTHLNCLCYNGDLTIITTALSVDRNGVGEQKTLSITRYADGTESDLVQINPIEGLQRTEMIAVSIEKLIESQEPILEEPFSDWDIACDNIFGGSALTCSKRYTMSAAFDESFSTEHGFDISVTVGKEFEASLFFAKLRTTFQIQTGYSFSSGYTQTNSFSVDDTFTYELSVAPGTKAEIRFFKSEQPVKIKWRTKMFADGRALIRFGSTLEKKIHLSQLLSYGQRELHAIGTLDYGERETVTGRTKTLDRDGNLISLTDEDKPVPK